MAKPNKATTEALNIEPAAEPKDSKGKVTQEPVNEDEGHVEIDLDEGDEGDSDDPPEEREKASVRRRNRFKENEERARLAEERAEQETAARRRAEEDAHRLRTQGPQQQPSVRQQVDAEYNRLFQLKIELQKQVRAEEHQAGDKGLPEERVQFFHRQASEIMRAENRLAAYEVELESAPRRSQEIREHYVRTNYADIVAKPEAVRYGLAAFNLLVAEGWDPNSNATVDEAAKRTRDNPKFGLKRAPKADAATTARLGGVPRGGPSNSAPVANPNKIRLDKKEQRIAREMYSDVSPEEAYLKHAKQLQKRASRKAQTEAE